MGETASGAERVARAAWILAQARDRHADTHRRMAEVRRAADGAARYAGVGDIDGLRHDVRDRYDRARQWLPDGGDADVVPRQRRRLDYFDAEFCLTADQAAMLAALLDATLALTRAEKCNVQLYDAAARGLRIAAQRGFEREFLEYFAFVGDGASACGAAMVRGRPVQVPDVTHSAVFGTGPARDVVLRAGVRSVRSIPLYGAEGVLLGMLSVHYGRTGGVDPYEERLLAVLATSAMRRLSR